MQSTRSVSVEVENQIALFLREIEATNDRDNVLIAELFTIAAAEYEVVAAARIQPILLAARKSAYISILRSAPNAVLLGIMETLGDDEEALTKVNHRMQKLCRYLLAFQPAIFKSIEDHFMKKGAICVSFAPKVAGQQVGTIATVEYDSCKTRQFFVKTHQNFQVSGESFAHITSDKAKNVDYKELFVYRVLQELKLGPEIEFIFSLDVSDSTIAETGLLIASLDLSYFAPSMPPLLFKPFEVVRSQLRHSLRQQGLQDEALAMALDSSIKNVLSSPVARHDLKGIDLVCRIMHLNDVLVNVGNFGQTVHAQTEKEMNWRILDFTVGLTGIYDDPVHYVIPNIAMQYRVVNGSLRYDENQPLRETLLESTHLNNQLKEEIFVGVDGKPALETILHRTFAEIQLLVESRKDMLHLKEDLHKKKLRDLEVFAEATICNISAL